MSTLFRCLLLFLGVIQINSMRCGGALWTNPIQSNPSRGTIGRWQGGDWPRPTNPTSAISTSSTPRSSCCAWTTPRPARPPRYVLGSQSENSIFMFFEMCNKQSAWDVIKRPALVDLRVPSQPCSPSCRFFLFWGSSRAVVEDIFVSLVLYD